ncbi:MAG: ABC transporter permease [Candidatus Peregrinibacteria bacterium]
MKLRHVNTIAGKELHSYFNSPLGVILLSVFLMVSSALFFSDFFLMNQSSMRTFFEWLPWIFLFLIPAVTMRLWAEEKKLGMMEPLLTSPLTLTEVVLGKFLASLLFLLLALALSGIIPAILFFIGQPDFGAIAAGYLGAFLLGAAYLSLGLFISSLTDNQIVAFAVSVLILFVLLVAGQEIVLSTVPQTAIPFLKYMAIGLHFEGLVRGVIDSRDVVYYLLFIFLFLHFNVASISHQKWV